MPELAETVRLLLADQKGHLAMDDSNATCDKRFAAEESLAGCKGETVTEGPDGLRERLLDHAGMGARFAKWRAVFALGEGMPSRAGLDANAHALARDAALCHEAGIVPVVEPEVLTAVDHGMARCAEATEGNLRRVFEELAWQNVALETMILKPNMVLPGLVSPEQPSPAQVAEATPRTLCLVVPAAVPGVALLSGGQSGLLASARRNAINLANAGPASPWAVTFSFARAIQQPALQIWDGKDANRPDAQRALLHRAACNSAALPGLYSADLEVGFM